LGGGGGWGGGCWGGALLPRIHSYQPLGLIRKNKKEKKWLVAPPRALGEGKVCRQVSKIHKY